MGYASKKKGEAFERMLEQGVLSTGGFPIRIADGAKRVGLPGPPYYRYIPQRQPFDYIVVYDDKVIFLDCKTTSFKSVTYSKIYPPINTSAKNLKATASIAHQLKSLEKLNNCGMCGFLYYFEEFGKIIFFTVDMFKELKPGKSLKPDDGIFLGNPSNFDLRILVK